MINATCIQNEVQDREIDVLVLDDEEQARRLVDRVLSKFGCNVHTARNGREGLQILLERDFDVLIIDVRMDGMDGPTFLREAQKIWPWLGVIIITGLADPETIERVHKLGVTHILQKPFSFENLRNSVLVEAEAKRKRVEQPTILSLDRIQYQLGILRQLSENAIASGSLVEALRGLSRVLARLLPSAVIGVLGEEDKEQALILTVQRAVSPLFLNQIQEEVYHQYEALTGRRLDPDALRIQCEGISTDLTGPEEIGSTFTVPVIAGGELNGLLILGSETDGAYRTEDVSFLYHAANHLTAIFAALNQMHEIAIQDSLTGLYNRRRLEEELDMAWDRSRRYGHSMSAAMIDLDQFKPINDQYGHLVGDQVLRELADLVRNAARTTDVISRYGGDEFVVLLSEGGLVAGRAFAERFVFAVKDHVFCEATHALRLTASVGIGHSETHSHLRSGRDVLEHADRALYSAKRAGRNQVAVWSSELQETLLCPIPDEAHLNSGVASSNTACQGRILLVDDEPDICRPLKMILESKQYEVAIHENVKDAMESLASNPGKYDVLITDLHMPGKSGFDLLKELNRVDQAIVKIVVTGNATMENAIESLRHGAYDFIEKPISPDQLLLLLDRALEYRRLHVENMRYRLYLEDMVRERSAALSEALNQLTESYDFTLEAMVALLDARERATGEHTVRVRKLAEHIAQRLGLAPEEVQTIGRGALLHDIGKIAIPDYVLLKPGSLTPEEQTIMRGHAEIGYRVLKSSSPLQLAAEIVHSHHEKFDGTGYPRGLKGEAICFGARIFAVADAYDAMRSNRPYRKSMGILDAVNEIKAGRDTQFDPNIVDIFLDSFDEMEAIGAWG